MRDNFHQGHKSDNISQPVVLALHPDAIPIVPESAFRASYTKCRRKCNKDGAATARVEPRLGDVKKLARV